MVYQTEKSMEELKDKLSDEEKSKITAACDKVKEALKGTDNDAIKGATEELTKEFYEISAKIYQQTQQAGGQQGQPSENEAQGEVVDDEPENK